MILFSTEISLDTFNTSKVKNDIFKYIFYLDSKNNVKTTGRCYKKISVGGSVKKTVAY